MFKNMDDKKLQRLAEVACSFSRSVTSDPFRRKSSALFPHKSQYR